MNGIKRTYYITSELEDGIRKLAYLRKTTLSDIVREAIEFYLAVSKDDLLDMPPVKLLRRDGTILNTEQVTETPARGIKT